MQKARHHTDRSHRALTACMCTGSGTISLPTRGTFHCSLTLLFATGYQGILSLGGWSPQIHARFHGTGATREISEGTYVFVYWTITILGGTSQTLRLTQVFVTFCPDCSPNQILPQHPNDNACRLDITQVWAISVSLAATQEVEVSFFS